MELKVLKTICILAIIVDFIECYDWPRFRPGLNCSDLNPQRTVNIAEVRYTSNYLFYLKISFCSILIIFESFTRSLELGTDMRSSHIILTLKMR